MATLLPNSTFLDFTSYSTTTATTVADAYGLSGAPIPAQASINVAFILPRANDPTALLASNWGVRQATLEHLNDSGTLWSTYGASATDYTNTKNALAGYGTLLGLSGNDGYITSQDSRTVWVSLTPAQFHIVFDTPLYQSTHDGGMYYWNGSLSVPTGLTVAGLWFDTAPDFGTPPADSDLSGGARVTPPQGPLSIGNALSASDHQTNNFSGDIANSFYHFPLSGIAVPTATIGLIEPGIGDAVPPDVSFQHGFDAFRHAAGISTPGNYYLVSSATDGQNYVIGNSGERSLDVGVVTSANPGSTIGLYAGSGFHDVAHSNVFTAFQAAFWDGAHDPAVVSSSFSILQQTAPGSPFAFAVQQLFIDAALHNITVANANNDFGSSWSFGDGIANQAINSSSPYIILVGGTSLTTLAAAFDDPTLAQLNGLAMAGDLPTLWQLVEGGLMKLPSAASGSDGVENALLESVWNSFALTGSDRTPLLGASDGGVDTSQPTPAYQSAFGLVPTSVNPSGGTGRGAPDVSADAGGNMFYNTPLKDMMPGSHDDGTSASTPLWATLVSQIDTIFHDQGLPNPGYMNDLLYTAAAIAPASFNDITMGNNITSFLHRGPIIDANGDPLTLTGYGYHAGRGYDLTTGLGSPNGTLLARTLTDIAHSEMWFGSSPDMLDSNGQGGWTSGADQSLLFQTMSDAATQVGVHTGPDAFGFFSTASGSFAWTSQLAEQALQPDFDPNLVILFDKQAQGAAAQVQFSTGEALAVSVNTSPAQAIQGTLSSPFGFADFLSGDGAVRVARPVAVAETADGANDQTAIVRLRQDGQDNTSITFYRVDDLNGTINGLHPGDAGYQAALQSRAYQMTSGGTSIGGPGYGNYEQTGLSHVNAGDLVAMQFTNNTHGNSYLGFAQANEMVNGQYVGHLWNYGLNTWGWEDTYGGGDRDYNDLIVQLDFTSASGHGWLA